MSNKHETIADIVAQLRAAAHIQNADSPRDVLKFADRIEAAATREREAGAEAAQICGEVGEMVGRDAACRKTVTDCHGLGNAAAMREALEKVRFYLPYFLQYMRLHREDEKAGGYYESILEVVSAAISAPPRNCDRPECATSKAAQDVWRKDDGGKTAYHEWLLTSTKGGAK